MAHRPNVYKRDIPANWYKELGAFVLVLIIVTGLRILYYYTVGE